MSRRSIVLVSLILAALVLACGSTQQSQITSTAAPAAGGDSTAAPAAPAQTVGKVGDRVEANGVALTVVKVEKATQISDFQKAEEGKTFVIAEVLIENVSTDTAPYNPLYFKVKDSEGFEENSSLMTGDGALKSGELAKGEKARGNVAFQVKAEAAGLVMEYKPLVVGNVVPIRVALE
jgi:hypothetical protein